MSSTPAAAIRRLRYGFWVATDRLVRWAASPIGRAARLRRVALAAWIGCYALMSVVDFLREGAPTRWVLIVPTLVAAAAATLLWATAWHPGSQVFSEVVAARRVRARFGIGAPPQVAGLPQAVDRHRVASSTAPRPLRRAQRAEVAELVAEVNGFVVAAHTVDLVRVDLTDGSVHPVAGAEASYADLVAVAAHRVRRIDELTDAAIGASLDERAAVAGHLDRVAVAARLAAQRQVDGDPAELDAPAPAQARPAPGSTRTTQP